MLLKHQVTRHLRRLAEEAHTMVDSGEVQTKAEALALLLWNRALGWTERTINDAGEEVEIKHPSESWAVHLLLDRLEGKVTPNKDADSEARTTAAEKVSEMAKERINKLVESTPSPKPPSIRRKP